MQATYPALRWEVNTELSVTNQLGEALRAQVHLLPLPHTLKNQSPAWSQVHVHNINNFVVCVLQ